MEKEENNQESLSHTVGIKDSAILHLVRCANLGAGVDVTILVDGQVMAGVLASGEEYAKESAKGLRGANADTSLKEAIASFFDELAIDYRQEEGHDIPLNFLHMKNPSYMRGDGNWTNVTGTIVRIPIEKVSGFSLGIANNI